MNQALLARNEVPIEKTWDTSTIYESLDAFQAEVTHVKNLYPQLVAYQGKLAESKQTLYSALTLRDDLIARLHKLYTFAHLNNDVDTTNATFQSLMAQTRNLVSEVTTSIAFIEPELLATDQAVIESYLQDDSLKVYQFQFELLFRNRPYTLSEKEEALLAMGEQLYEAGQTTFSVLNNADLKFPTIQDDNGNDVELSHARYGTLLESKNRQVRHDAFKALYKTYRSLENTFASTLAINVKAHNTTAMIRGYQSARQAALFHNTIDESVYDSLLEAVHEKLPYLHKYVELRKKVLGLTELKPYDLAVSMISDLDLKFTFEEAKEITLNALSVLGEEYVSILKEAFENRWIDQDENIGKRSGAYSSGCYGTNPFILLNWQGTLDHLYTLVHELGHSVHSYYTRKNQPFAYGDYSIFLAEIASTTNENLLTAYLLKKYADNKPALATIINHFLDGVKGTVYRQTQFAEFEHMIHQADQNNQPLTATALNQMYFDLNKKYYGDGLTYEVEIESEWARIPHFYYNYYVYQYATGFSAAVSFSEMILEQGQPAVEKYIGFLKAGWSDYPLNVLKKAGVDMSTNQATVKTLELFNERLTQLSELLTK